MMIYTMSSHVVMSMHESDEMVIKLLHTGKKILDSFPKTDVHNDQLADLTRKYYHLERMFGGLSSTSSSRIEDSRSRRSLAHLNGYGELCYRFNPDNLRAGQKMVEAACSFINQHNPGEGYRIGQALSMMPPQDFKTFYRCWHQVVAEDSKRAVPKK